MADTAKQLKDILKEANARIIISGTAYGIENVVEVEGRMLIIPTLEPAGRRSRTKAPAKEVKE